jgi:hypothetical protein
MQLTPRSVMFLAFTCCFGALYLPSLLPKFREKATQYATHFCPSCGLHLAYWNGSTHVFACGEYLAGAIPGSSKGEIGSAEVKVPLSPWGQPPPQNSRLYMLAKPSLSEKTIRLEPDWDSDRRFLRGVVDPSTNETVFEIQPPVFEKHEFHNTDVFLPFDPDNRGHAMAAQGIVNISRAPGSPDSSLANIIFNRSDWDLVIQRGSPGCLDAAGTFNLGVHDDRCVAQRLYFPFLSSGGPLIWTVRKGMKGMVLLDAYDRVVAFGDLEVCDIGISKTLVEEIVLTYLALRIQTQRFKERIQAVSNEREVRQREKDHP